METYDILMLIVLGGATLFGAIKGFAWQLASIGSIVVSYLVAYHFREPFSESIKAEPPWNRFLAMLILYVGTSLVIWMVFRMVSRTIDRMKLKEFDRQVGALFGLAKGALYCTLITLFAVTLLGQNLREKIVGSRSGHYIARVLDKSQAVIPPELHEVVQPVLDKFERRFHGTGGNDGGGGFLPSWPGSNSGGDGNSFQEAILNRFGSQGASPTSLGGETTNQNSDQPWNGNRPNPWQSQPNPWQSGQSTPIEASVRSAASRFSNQAASRFDEFGRAIDRAGESVGRAGQAFDQNLQRAGQSIDQGFQQGFQAVQQGRQSLQQTARDAVRPFQPQAFDSRPSSGMLRQSYGRPSAQQPGTSMSPPPSFGERQSSGLPWQR